MAEEERGAEYFGGFWEAGFSTPCIYRPSNQNFGPQWRFAIPVWGSERSRRREPAQCKPERFMGGLALWRSEALIVAASL